jgi:hypothetical protein
MLWVSGMLLRIESNNKKGLRKQKKYDKLKAEKGTTARKVG